MCGVSLSAEVDLLGVKAKVIGKDRKPVKGFEQWRLMGEEETGVVRQDLGPGAIDDPFAQKEEPELNLDDFGADLGFDGPSLSRDEQEKADKLKARQKKKELLSLPRDYKYSQLEKNGGVKQPTPSCILRWQQRLDSGES